MRGALRVRRLGLPILATLWLAACTQPLSGRYEDVSDASRYYTFSKWSKSWTSYYDETGGYSVDGNTITLDGGGGITGEIISAGEFHLNDVTAWSADKKFNVYRRTAE